MADHETSNEIDDRDLLWNFFQLDLVLLQFLLLVLSYLRIEFLEYHPNTYQEELRHLLRVPRFHNYKLHFHIAKFEHEP